MLQLNEVRENGAVILTVSGTADLVFPPTPNELMLPAEIVAALLDVIVRRDENNAIVISRKGIQAETIRTGAKHAPWEIFQIEYDYNFSRYTSSGDHSLVLRGTGRVGDARLSFIANSSIGVTHNSSRPTLHGGTVRLDRPNGQSFVGGRIWHWHRRGIHERSRTRWVGPIAFGSRATGFLWRANNFRNTATYSSRLSDPANLRLSPFSALAVRYDTKIFGAIATTATQVPRQSRLHVFCRRRCTSVVQVAKETCVAGGVKYMSGLNRFQADVAVGQFSGVNRDATQTSGTGMAINLTGSYHLTDQVLLQGRYTYVGRKFLSPQSGLHATKQPRPRQA